MQFLFSSLLVLALAACALAIKPDTQNVIIGFSDHTPPHILEEIKKAVYDAEGTITHEFTLISAFAAKVPSKVLDSIRTMGQDYGVLIEQDQEVSISNEQ